MEEPKISIQHAFWGWHVILISIFLIASQGVRFDNSLFSASHSAYERGSFWAKHSKGFSRF